MSGLRQVRGGKADGLLKTAELAEVVAQVDDVEAPPLVRAQGTEEEVGGDALEAKALLALVEQDVHLFHFLAKKIGELRASHGRPVKLTGTGKNGSGRAARHLAEGENGDLQRPLGGGTAVVCRAAALEPLCEDAVGAAEGEHEMFDEALGGPEPVILTRMELTPVGRLAGELGVPGVKDLLQDGMHGIAAGPVSWELYH